MGIFDNIFRKKQQDQSKNEIGKISLPIKATYLERITKDISAWREAQELAEYVDNPDRIELMKIYKDLIDDSQIFSCMQIRTNKATNGKAQIKNEQGDFDEKINSLFFDSQGTPQYWFRKFLFNAQYHKYYGFVCLQIQKGIDQIAVQRLPEENLVPQWDGFLWNIEMGYSKADSNFSRFDNNKYKNYLIPIGEKYDLGLLNKVAPYMIWKEVFGSWSMHADLFGQPLRVGKTDIRDKDRRKNMIDMLANMTKSTYTVLDTTDLVEFIESSKGDPHSIYKELITQCDQAISKIILGGTGIVDEKAFVGSAQIQNSILDDIIKSDKFDLAAIVNESLIPRLQKFQMIPEGKYTMTWNFDETLNIKDWATVISQLSMAGYRMTKEEIESKLNIELEDFSFENSMNPEEKETVQAISKMYNLYKDYK